jgi:hypothetical protein
MADFAKQEYRISLIGPTPLQLGKNHHSENLPTLQLGTAISPDWRENKILVVNLLNDYLHDQNPRAQALLICHGNKKFVVLNILDGCFEEFHMQKNPGHERSNPNVGVAICKTTHGTKVSKLISQTFLFRINAAKEVAGH